MDEDTPCVELDPLPESGDPEVSTIATHTPVESHRMPAPMQSASDSHGLRHSPSEHTKSSEQSADDSQWKERLTSGHPSKAMHGTTTR